MNVVDLLIYVILAVMEIIKGGDQPKTVLEQRVYGFKHIVDWSKVNLPKYNPWQIELARHLDGLTKVAFAKTADMSTKKYSDIEKGNVTPTEAEVDQILGAQTHVIRTFYEQWPETEIDFSGPFGKLLAIDYYKYKVFRDVNPRMKAV